MAISYSEIKAILDKHMPRGQLFHISDIHDLVNKHYNLSNED